MFKLIYTFIFLIFSFGSFAQGDNPEQPPKSFLIIAPFESQDVTSLELQQINKSMLRAATRQQEYSFTMSDDDITFKDVKNKITSLNVEVVERKNQKGIFDISVYLQMVRNKKIIKKSTKSNVSKRDMLRTVELLANNLLGIEDIDVDNKQKKKLPLEIESN